MSNVVEMVIWCSGNVCYVSLKTHIGIECHSHVSVVCVRQQEDSNMDSQLRVQFFLFSLSPRYWMGPFAGRLKFNEDL